MNKESRKIILRGVPASPGIAKGKAKIVFSPAGVNNFDSGDILVAPLTNPQYTEAILKAIAIVTDIGGILSHPAIVAREMGIPCVTGTDNATKILKNGEEITVDGNEGEIYSE